MRTERASLWQFGMLSHPLLLWGIAFELVFTAALIYLPPYRYSSACDRSAGLTSHFPRPSDRRVGHRRDLAGDQMLASTNCATMSVTIPVCVEHSQSIEDCVDVGS